MSEENIKNSIRYNLRIIFKDSTKNIIKEESKLENELFYIDTCITPYSTIINTVEYTDSGNSKQTESFETIENYEEVIPSEYKDANSLFLNENFDSFNECLNKLKEVLDYKTFTNNKISFKIYIDYLHEIDLSIDQEFIEFLLKRFNGNYEFYGNNRIKLNLPNSEIDINNFTIERFNIIATNLFIMHANQAFINNCRFNGSGKIPNEVDQFVLYLNNGKSSDISNIILESGIKIGINGVLGSSYLIAKSKLSLNNIRVNFETSTEKFKLYDHIFKINGFNKLEIIDFKIEKSMSKLVPIKIQSCNEIMLFKYSNLFRIDDKGTNEVSITDTIKADIVEFEVSVNNTNNKRSCALAFNDSKTLMDLYFSDINIKNLDFLSITNSSCSTLYINKFNIETDQYVFNFDEELYIGELTLNNSKIYSQNFVIENLSSLHLSNSYLESKNINLKFINYSIYNTELNSINDININVDMNEISEEKGECSLKDSVIVTSKKLNINALKNNTSLRVENTKFNIKSYFDTMFDKVYFREARFEISDGEFNSNEYSLKSTTFSNSKFLKDKPLIFNGNVNGDCILEAESSEIAGFTFNKDSFDFKNRNKLTINFFIKNEALELISNITLNNECMSILLDTYFRKSGKIITNFIINGDIDTYLESSNYLLKTKNSTQIDTFLKYLTADKFVNVEYLDGSLPMKTTKKLLFGVKP